MHFGSTRGHMPHKKPADYVMPEAFVRAWQTTDSAAETAAMVGISVSAARQRAKTYRLKGIPLKHHRSGKPSRLDVPRLAALARSLTPK